jgi:hypothetical protein
MQLPAKNTGKNVFKKAAKIPCEHPRKIQKVDWNGERCKRHRHRVNTG